LFLGGGSKTEMRVESRTLMLMFYINASSGCKLM